MNNCARLSLCQSIFSHVSDCVFSLCETPPNQILWRSPEKTKIKEPSTSSESLLAFISIGDLLDENTFFSSFVKGTSFVISLRAAVLGFLSSRKSFSAPRERFFALVAFPIRNNKQIAILVG